MTIPEVRKGYVHRTSLVQRIEAALESRLTVLRAPAGFGKTTVLSDVCRRKRSAGVVVGWLSLDDDDAPNMLGSYILCALECGGLDLAVMHEFDAWCSSPVARQMGTLARAVHDHSAPCLLIFDEVDMLPHRSVLWLDRLLKRGPDNLHVALAFRSNPGLDIATHVLNRVGSVISTEQFRFSRSQIGLLFQGELPRRELAAVQDWTAGWPVALTVWRNVRMGARGGEPGVDPEELVSNYVEVRLFAGLPPEVRAALLEIAVFDRIEPDLVDDVLGSSDARLCVVKRPELDGILLPVDKDGGVRRLHPLVKEYCDARLSVDAPARKQLLHTRIARALCHRFDLTAAWRHASAAGGGRLVGELVEQVGVFSMWLRAGMTPLFSADEYLTPEIAAAYPRCALLRCLVLRAQSKFGEARAMYASAARGTDNFTPEPDGSDSSSRVIDGTFTHAALAVGDAPAPSDETEPSSQVEDGAERVRLKSILRCVSCFRRASFEECRRHGMSAQAALSEDMRYGRVFVDIHLGMAAMAQGCVEEASARYARVRQEARAHFAGDPCLAACAEAVTIELDLERNRTRGLLQRTLKGLPHLRGAWNGIHAMAVGVHAELMSTQHDGESVLPFLTQALEEVQPAGSRSLSHYMSSLLVFYLLECGRLDQAAQLWSDSGLPTEDSALLDLERQPWRAMEAIACARIRLLAGQGDQAGADVLARRLCSTASECGLTRTLLRGLALSMVVAHRMGRMDTAQARLVDSLRLTGEADYFRPLVRTRDITRTVLASLLDTNLDVHIRSIAESVLPHLGSGPEPLAALSSRELDVVSQIRQDRANREIADALGISEAGVRYHLRNIYRKTGATRREDIARKTRLPDG